jgi:hypothetical protein
MNKIVRRFRSLFRNTKGNGEWIATMLVIGLVLTAGLAVTKVIGSKAQEAANGEGDNIAKIPGTGN